MPPPYSDLTGPAIGCSLKVHVVIQLPIGTRDSYKNRVSGSKGKHHITCATCTLDEHYERHNMSDQDPTAEPYFPSEDEQFYSAEDKELLEAVERPLVGWLPKSGDVLIGKVLDITDGTSEYGDYPLLTVETPSKNLVGVHCFHLVLKNDIQRRIDKGRLKIGDRIAIKYSGEGEAKGGSGKNAPNMYRVSVKQA